jgi:L-ascorbate metabolism protein UlaG (beta-lactamase superfamily)
MKLSRRRLFTLLAAAGAAGAGGYGARAATSRYYEGPISDHFDGVRFLDPDGVPPKGIRDLIRWWNSGRRSEWPLSRPSPYSDRPPPRVSGSQLRVAFVGHASLLLQAGGQNVLIDPVWSERVSPVSFAGPRRVNEPGIAFEALPRIDAVLVSHCHYDHLDVATLSRLAASHGPRVITPLGNDSIMRRHDAAIRAEAYDWGERVDLGPLAVTLMPMRHWSARHLFDRNKALWAAFSIETPAGRVYHVGDSGYGDGRRFREAREHGPIRLAILPIGAYEPRWFMREQHMEPAESVKAFLDLGADFAMAHHHGTFQLTDEPIDAPERALLEAREAAGIAPQRFRILKPGEAWELEG